MRGTFMRSIMVRILMSCSMIDRTGIDSPGLGCLEVVDVGDVEKHVFVLVIGIEVQVDGKGDPPLRVEACQPNEVVLATIFSFLRDSRTKPVATGHVRVRLGEKPRLIDHRGTYSYPARCHSIAARSMVPVDADAPWRQVLVRQTFETPRAACSGGGEAGSQRVSNVVVSSAGQCIGWIRLAA